MLPLYFQVEQQLRAEIESGRLAPGVMLPTEAQLCERFGVSRITVGKALDALAADWLIVRRQGVGTFVAKNRGPGKSVTLVASLDEMLAPARDVSRELLGRGLVKAPAPVATALAIGPKADVACFEALFRSGGEPYSFSRQYMPSPLAEGLLERPAGVPDLQLLEQVAGVRVERAQQSIKPVAADSVCAHHLDLTRRTPILEVMRTYFRGDGKPIGTTVAFFHPDRYRYEVELVPRAAAKSR